MGNTKRGENEGSIRERKDGRFEVRVTRKSIITKHLQSRKKVI